jgi:poly(A) polymerase
MTDGAAMDDQAGFPEGSQANPVVLTKSFHPITAEAVDSDARKILYRLHRCGFIAYLCGGAVRDLMVGKKPKDFDIVTDARPGQIKKRFGNAYIIGRRFRLAHIHFAGGKIIEVATFRGTEDRHEESPSDIATTPTGGPQVHIYGTPREDAFRRDITINALFYDLFSDSVIDYVGGIEDLALRRIRMIGDPETRFKDDPVRIWRSLRHAARLGFALAPEVEQCIPSALTLLDQCSGARLYEELNKDLAYETRPVIEALRRFRVLRHVIGRIGEAYENDDFLFSRLLGLLDAADLAKSAGYPWALRDMHALLLLPWAEPLLTDGQDDPGKILKIAIQNSEIKATLPRLLRADLIQIIILIQAMRRALGTGRFRWSLKKRAQYQQASRLFYLIEKGRPPQAEETFETLFRAAYPSSADQPELRKKRRRRKRKPRFRPGPPDQSGRVPPLDH